MVLAGKALEEVRLELAARGSPAQRGDVELTRQPLESQSRASSAS